MFPECVKKICLKGQPRIFVLFFCGSYLGCDSNVSQFSPPFFQVLTPFFLGLELAPHNEGLPNISHFSSCPATYEIALKSLVSGVKTPLSVAYWIHFHVKTTQHARAISPIPGDGEPRSPQAEVRPGNPENLGMFCLPLLTISFSVSKVLQLFVLGLRHHGVTASLPNKAAASSGQAAPPDRPLNRDDLRTVRAGFPRPV